MTETIDLYYARLREQNRIQREKRRAECVRLCPALRDLEEERGAAFRLPPQKAAETLKALKAREKELLRSVNLPEDHLEMRYTCPLCRDTGYTGGVTKQKCVCRLKKEQESYRVASRISFSERFDSFSEDIYPDETQRARGRRILEVCRGFADSLPRPEKPQMLFLGMTGLGKSFFGNAIANAALEKGLEARRITSYALIGEVTDSFTSGSDPIARYSSVPLLVLDDLGSEPMMQNVTEPSLFSLIDRRSAAGLPTVFITNLLPNELRERFQERISSRILDTRCTTVIHFKGDNLRSGKGRKS